jgi:hypothetical protein
MDSRFLISGVSSDVQKEQSKPTCCLVVVMEEVASKRTVEHIMYNATLKTGTKSVCFPCLSLQFISLLVA